jgi:hypothetical protein
MDYLLPTTTYYVATPSQESSNGITLKKPPGLTQSPSQGKLGAVNTAKHDDNAR